MGIRVDPRTGMIVSGPSRPVKFPPSKSSPKEPTQLHPAVQLTLAQLKEFAQEIGKVIAEELKSVKVLPILPARRPYISPESVDDVFEIDIDESIIDVGIGKQEPLKKGKGSTRLAKDTTEKDNLAKSKQSLKRLKG